MINNYVLLSIQKYDFNRNIKNNLFIKIYENLN